MYASQYVSKVRRRRKERDKRREMFKLSSKNLRDATKTSKNVFPIPRKSQEKPSKSELESVGTNIWQQREMKSDIE